MATCGGCPKQDPRVRETMASVEAALRRLDAANSSPGSASPPAFASRGQSLDGGPQMIRNVQNVPNMLLGGFKQLDSKTKALVYVDAVMFLEFVKIDYSSPFQLDPGWLPFVLVSELNGHVQKEEPH
ncbi:hypothetical protein V5O48_000937 [Marasmius crinis-equi]|uniref:Uncharacterized protein n=1 Tax=Marasmius crinis-equi TaxID=585013 RepID=A0ABR3FZT6_9AGAR